MTAGFVKPSVRHKQKQMKHAYRRCLIRISPHIRKNYLAHRC